MHGRDGDDTISGNDGNDSIYGEKGNDIIDGGQGNDTIDGGDGDDIIRPSEGDDIISAGDGYDVIYISDGNNSIDGGDGEDYLSYTNNSVGINVDSSAGIVTVTDISGTRSDTIVNIENFEGSDFDDILFGRDTDNAVSFELNAVNGDFRNYEQFKGGKGADNIDGKGGYDELSYTSSPVGLTIDLANSSQEDGFGTIDTIANIEGVEGTKHDDIIYGTDGNNSLDGRKGNNTIDGREGFDYVEYNGVEPSKCFSRSFRRISILYSYL